MPALRTLFVLTMSLSTTACGSNRDKSGDAKVSFNDSTLALPELAAGDVMITSTDGAFVMAVVGDSVRMQLSDSLRASVRSDVSAKGKEGGIGGFIASSVGDVVSKAMGFAVRMPVDEVTNLRYVDGKIQFSTKSGQVNVSGSSSGKGGATFAEADARRFIDAVHARQQQKTGAH